VAPLRRPRPLERATSLLTRRKFLKRASVFAAGSLGVTRMGYASAQGLPGLRRITLDFPSLPPQWDGLTVLQISDVHAGAYMPVDRMRRIRDLANSLPADIVVFTGDQLDRRRVDADMFVQGFAGINAPLGVFGVLGNHDYRVSPRRAVWTLKAAGITPLVNRSAVLERRGEKLALIGVDDLLAPPGLGPDFSVVRQHRDAFRLVLCHQPQGWDEARRLGADLTLAGHTHGGQIALPTRNLNPARMYTRYIAGPYFEDDSTLYVSRGIGVGAVPLRLGAPPELDLITLRRTAPELSAVAA
jgi:predicted MPP superfamily phosphohydrolase